MKLRLSRKTKLVVSVYCLFSQITVFAERVTDPSNFEKSFAVSPTYVTVGSDLGKPISLCLAAFNKKSGETVAIGSSPLSAHRTCSGDRDSYFSGKASAPPADLLSNVAEFSADPFEQGSIDKTLWLFQGPPISFTYKITDSKSGKETWEAFCATVIYPDPDYSKSKEAPRMLVYSRDPKPGSIEKGTKIKCGGMTYALGHQLKTEKPLLVGDPMELSKLANQPDSVEAGSK